MALRSDEQLMCALAEKESTEAFEELVSRYEKPMFAFIMRLLDDYLAAQDCFQETFCRIFRHRESYNRKFKFITWSYRIATNLCLDELRKKRRFAEEAIDVNFITREAASAFVTSSPEERLINEDVAQQVKHMVCSLPETLSTVLVLSQYQELPLKDIAVILGIPLGTVKSRLNTAFRTLAQLAARGGLMS